MGKKITELANTIAIEVGDMLPIVVAGVTKRVFWGTVRATLRTYLQGLTETWGISITGNAATATNATTATTATNQSGGTVAATTISASGLVTNAGEDTLTAFAGGDQGSATALSATKNYHRITTCASQADSVKLPAATAGQAHYVRNDGATSCQVFGTSPDTINGSATGTGVLLGKGTGAWFVCTTAGGWTTTGLVSLSAATRTRTSPEAMVSGATAIVSFSTLVYDNLSELAAAGVFTAKATGTYHLSAAVVLESAAWDAGEIAILRVYKNGVLYAHGTRWVAQAAHTSLASLQVSVDVQLVAGEYIDCRVYHNQGANVNVAGDAFATYMSVHRVA